MCSHSHEGFDWPCGLEKKIIENDGCSPENGYTISWHRYANKELISIVFISNEQITLRLSDFQLLELDLSLCQGEAIRWLK